MKLGKILSWVSRSPSKKKNATQPKTDELKFLLKLISAHRPTLDKFGNALLARFDGISEGTIRTYLGCEMELNILDSTPLLSRKLYVEVPAYFRVLGSPPCFHYPPDSKPCV